MTDPVGLVGVFACAPRSWTSKSTGALSRSARSQDATMREVALDLKTQPCERER
jgi:hypothetical protein